MNIHFKVILVNYNKINIKMFYDLSYILMSHLGCNYAFIHARNCTDYKILLRFSCPKARQTLKLNKKLIKIKHTITMFLIRHTTLSCVYSLNFLINFIERLNVREKQQNIVYSQKAFEQSSDLNLNQS